MSLTNSSRSQKQIIAREFNYSETTFIHTPPTTFKDPSTGASIPEWTVDIFLTDCEVPFAGHPTIGTAVHALSGLGKPSDEAVKGRFKVKAGNIDLVYQNGEARAGIPFDIRKHSAPYNVDSLWALQPKLKEHVKGKPPKAMDVISIVRGMSFIYVQLESLEELGSVSLHAGRPSTKLDEDFNEGILMSMYYVLLPANEDAVVRLRTRMIEGTFEDPATGSASCGLGALLAMKEGLKGGKRKYEMVQAVEIGRKSDIGVEITMNESGHVHAVDLIGLAVGVMEGIVRY